MKNSLFKRVAAAAAAVPLALTQCLAFSSVAAENDAVQIVGNTVQDGAKTTITLDKLLYIPANQTESTWNITAATALAEMVGTNGTINKDKVLDLVKYVPESYRDAAKAAIEEYVLNNPVTFEVTADKDIVIKATVSQPNFNGNYGNTPGQALSQIADGYSAPALNKIDFSSVKVNGDLVITIKTSELDAGTTVPVQVVYKTADGDIYAGDFAKFANDKLTELEEVAKAAIAKDVPADMAAEATEKFLAKTALIRDKIEKADKAVNDALSKSGDYKSVSEALTAVNTFLSNKNIKKQIPTSAAGIAANETVKNFYDTAVNKASGKADIQITADQLGAFIDGITSKSVGDQSTELDIKIDGGKAVLVGAFDDAEADLVKDYVEAKGYAYVGSYKELTGTVDFSGIKTADTASVDVKIKRILVTETTTTTTTGTETTTTAEDTTTTTAEDTTTTTAEETTTTTTGSDTDTTTTTTGTDTAETTTTTTTTKVYDVTTSFRNQYVEVKATEGFYLNTEESFDLAQIEKVELHTVYNEGYTDDEGVLHVDKTFETDIQDITKDVTFGTATPANTYQKVENKFDYQIPLYYKNSALKFSNMNAATVTVYIGVKGDTDLNNIVDGRDSTATLSYYAKTSTEGNDATTVVLSPSTLVNGNPASVYEDFAAFLSDVQKDTGKDVTRFAKKADRLVDGRDATAILTFYAKSSVEEFKEMAENEPAKLWAKVTGTEA